MLPTLEKRLQSGERLDDVDVRWLWENADDEALARLSAIVRGRFHAPDVATYLIMGIVNYTNVCVARCDYCAFYKMPGEAGTYLLDFEQVSKRIEGVRSLGGTMVGFNGGFHPDLKVEDYIDLFRRVRERYGAEMTFYEMTVAEFMFVSKRAHRSYADVAAAFAASGTRWITGGGSEILDDAFRLRHAPGKYKVEDYYAAQAAILDAGLGSTATMVIGFDETLDERLSHLRRLRRFQDERLEKDGRGLASFLCWTYKPWNTDLGGTEIASREYLRWLAICRIYLDNFVNVRTSVLTQNENAMVGLRFGANDFDLPTEDEVTTRAGATISHGFSAILDAARGLGFQVSHRAPFPVASLVDG